MASSLLRLSTTRGLLVGLLATLSVFTLLRGHHAPGGGFAGGLLLAATLAVPLLSHGAAAARRTLRINPRTLVAVGLAAIAVAACAGLVVGGPLLGPLWGPELPSIGRLGTVFLFDVGVYLAVAGTALGIILALVEER